MVKSVGKAMENSKHDAKCTPSISEPMDFQRVISVVKNKDGLKVIAKNSSGDNEKMDFDYMTSIATILSTTNHNSPNTKKDNYCNHYTVPRGFSPCERLTDSISERGHSDSQHLPLSIDNILYERDIFPPNKASLSNLDTPQTNTYICNSLPGVRPPRRRPPLPPEYPPNVSIVPLELTTAQTISYIPDHEQILSTTVEKLISAKLLEFKEELKSFVRDEVRSVVFETLKSKNENSSSDQEVLNQFEFSRL